MKPKLNFINYLNIKRAHRTKITVCRFHQDMHISFQVFFGVVNIQSNMRDLISHPTQYD
jgi:hypothetical protein